MMPNGDRVISIRPNDPNYGEILILFLPSLSSCPPLCVFSAPLCCGSLCWAPRAQLCCVFCAQLNWRSPLTAHSGRHLPHHTHH